MSDPRDIPLLDDALEAVARKDESAYVEARFVVAREQSLVHDRLGARLGITEQRGSAVRVVSGDGVGLGATTDPSRYALGEAALAAYASARASAALGDPAPLVPASSGTGRWGVIAPAQPYAADEATRRDPDEEALPTLELVSRASWLADIDAALRETAAVCETHVALSASEREVHLLSSLGASTAQGWRSVVLELGAVACGDAGRAARSDVVFGLGAEAFAPLEAFDWYERARRLAEEAALLLIAPNVLAGRYPLVLAPDVVAVLLHETIAAPLVAPDSPLGVDTQLGAPVLSVRADPLREAALGAYGFDDLGRAAEAIDLVREGRVVARLDEPARPTLRASALEQPPRPALTSLELVAGATPQITLLADAGKAALYLEDAQRWWLSPARDAIVLEAAVARFIEPDGRLGGYMRAPVLEARVADLWQSLEAVGDTRVERPSPPCPEVPGGRVSYLVPMLRFADVYVR